MNDKQCLAPECLTAPCKLLPPLHARLFVISLSIQFTRLHNILEERRLIVKIEVILISFWLRLWLCFRLSIPHKDLVLVDTTSVDIIVVKPRPYTLSSRITSANARRTISSIERRSRGNMSSSERLLGRLRPPVVGKPPAFSCSWAAFAAAAALAAAACLLAASFAALAARSLATASTIGLFWLRVLSAGRSMAGEVKYRGTILGKWPGVGWAIRMISCVWSTLGLLYDDDCGWTYLGHRGRRGRRDKGCGRAFWRLYIDWVRRRWQRQYLHGGFNGSLDIFTSLASFHAALPAPTKYCDWGRQRHHRQRAAWSGWRGQLHSGTACR